MSEQRRRDSPAQTLWSRARVGSRGCDQLRERRLEALRRQVLAGTYVPELGRVAEALLAVGSFG